MSWERTRICWKTECITVWLVCTVHAFKQSENCRTKAGKHESLVPLKHRWSSLTTWNEWQPSNRLECYTNDTTLAILCVGFHVAAGSVCRGKCSATYQLWKVKVTVVRDECLICLICQCRANKELCKHCTVSTLVRVILFDSLQCLIRSSSPLYTLTGKEIQLDYFTFTTFPSDDRTGRLTICILMDQ